LQSVELHFVKKLLNWEPVKDWFGHTRRERRSTFILLVIIIIIILVRYLVPEKNIEILYVTPDLYDSSGSVEISEAGNPQKELSFDFNPNSASYDTLIKAGFDPREANTLISYRKKGGKFRQPSDIRKVYGLDSLKTGKLIHHVVLSHVLTAKSDSHQIPQEKRLLNLNTIDSMALIDLPGIGPVLSSRIIKYRNMLGGFAVKEQLREVYGLSEETFLIIKGKVFTDSSEVRKININSADYRALSHIPYIEKYEISAILKYRELKGRITGINDLVENKLVTSEKVSRIRPYLVFE
jgi:competence protein ComEA